MDSIVEKIGFSSDDEEYDSNFAPDEINPEEELQISQCIGGMQNCRLYIANVVDMSYWQFYWYS